MANINPSSYIIGIVLFMLVIVGGISILGDFRDADSNFISDNDFTDFSDSFDKSEDLEQQVNYLGNNVTNAEPDTGTLGAIGGLINSAWKSIRLLSSSFSFMNSVFHSLSMFGIPAWIPTLLILIVTIIITFAILSLIFQRTT